MPGSAWHQHDGRRYLRVVYGDDPALAAQTTYQALELISGEPAGSVVRTLVDLRTSSMTGWDREVMADARRSISDLTARYSMRVAVLGVRGPLAALMRGMSAISSGYKAIPAPTEEKALAYLMKD